MNSHRFSSLAVRVLDLVALPERSALGIDVEQAADRADEHRESVRTGPVRVLESVDRHGARHRDGSAGLDQSSRTIDPGSTI